MPILATPPLRLLYPVPHKKRKKEKRMGKVAVGGFPGGKEKPHDTSGLIQFIHLAWRRFGLAHCHGPKAGDKREESKEKAKTDH